MQLNKLLLRLNDFFMAKEETPSFDDVRDLKAAIYDRVALMKQTQAEIQALENELRIAQRAAIASARPSNGKGEK